MFVQEVALDFKRWEEAAQAWVKRGYELKELAELKLPTQRHFSTILDLGHSGDGHAVYLARHKGITCNTYYRLNITQGMLQWLLKCKPENLNRFPSSELNILCQPLGQFPLENNSVDLAISSRTLINLPVEAYKTLLGEVYRVLKPSGIFVCHQTSAKARNTIYLLN